MKLPNCSRSFRLFVVMSQLGLCALSEAAQPPAVKYLQLWNKLGSAAEVTHSEVGPPGQIVGDILYQPGRVGNGFRSAVRTGDLDVPNNFVVFKDLQFYRKGELELWYTPSWKYSSVGHVVDLLYYTTKGRTAYDVRLSFAFNDWQNTGGLWFADIPGVAGSIAYFYPSADPQWIVNTPLKFTIKWDGTLPLPPKVELLFNDTSPAPYIQSYWGNGGSFVWTEPMDLVVGSRPYIEEWARHPWEPNIDGVMDELKVWAYTTPPVANAGPDQVTVIKNWVRLDGSASLEYDGEPLTYDWTFTAKPADSTVALSGATTVAPGFEADVPGTYIMQLVVSDGHVLSVADGVRVYAQNTTEALGALNKMIGALVDTKELNPGPANALGVKVSQALMHLPAKPKVAINLLKAFIHQVQDFIKYGILSEASGRALLNQANGIIISLGG